MSLQDVVTGGITLELYSACSKRALLNHQGAHRSSGGVASIHFEELGLSLAFEPNGAAGFAQGQTVHAHATADSKLAAQVRGGAARLRLGPFSLPKATTWAHAGGWQCWSESPLVNESGLVLSEPDPTRRVFGDSVFYPYEEKPGCFHSWFLSWCGGSSAESGAYGLLASASERFAIAFVFDLPAKQVSVDVDCEGWSQGDLEFRVLLPLTLSAEHGLGEAIRRWRALEATQRAIRNMDESHGQNPPLVIPRPQSLAGEPLPLRGYTSWYHHYSSINLDLMIKNADSLRDEMKVFQIDDGYQSAIGDWTSTKGTFGRLSDFEDFLSDLAMRGVKPGLWLAPFVTVLSSRLATEHEDWLLKDIRGERVRAGYIPHWGGDFFVLDTERDDVRSWMDGVIAFWVARGVRFFKCDFLYGPGIAVARTPSGETLTRLERARRAHRFLYECISKHGASLLSCGAIMEQAVLACDFSRIGADVGVTWDEPNGDLRWSREKVSTRSAITNALTRFPWSGAGLLCDGDVSVVRSYETELDAGERQLLARVNAVSSDLQFVSCDMFDWNDEAKDIYRTLCEGALGERPDCLSVEVPEGAWGEDGIAQAYRVRVRHSQASSETLNFDLKRHTRGDA